MYIARPWDGVRRRASQHTSGSSTILNMQVSLQYKTWLTGLFRRGLFCGQLPGNLAERNDSSSVVRDLSLLLYSVVSLSHLSHITYELSIVMRSFGMTNIPSLVVSTSSNFDSVSKPFVTSLHRC